jgi:hypothetical protein
MQNHPGLIADWDGGTHGTGRRAHVPIRYDRLVDARSRKSVSWACHGLLTGWASPNRHASTRLIPASFNEGNDA